jgi:hypothetical protein
LTIFFQVPFPFPSLFHNLGSKPPKPRISPFHNRQMPRLAAQTCAALRRRRMAAAVDVFLVLRCVPIARQAVNGLHRIVLILERG